MIDCECCGAKDLSFRDYNIFEGKRLCKYCYTSIIDIKNIGDERYRIIRHINAMMNILEKSLKEDK